MLLISKAQLWAISALKLVAARRESQGQLMQNNSWRLLGKGFWKTGGLYSLQLTTVVLQDMLLPGM